MRTQQKISKNAYRVTSTLYTYDWHTSDLVCKTIPNALSKTNLMTQMTQNCHCEHLQSCQQLRVRAVLTRI